VVQIFRPFCSPIKVDLGFIQAATLTGVPLFFKYFLWRQYSVGQMREFGIVICHPFSHPDPCP